MKPIKIVSFAVVAALVATAFVGTTLAVAESTALCEKDPGELEECPSLSRVTHVHESTSSKAKLVTNFLTIECDVLFLGDVKSANNLGAPLKLVGNFTYTNCGGCTATETSKNFEIEVLRLGHELADVTGVGQVHVVCGTNLDCEYKGEGLVGHALGPLLVAEGGNANGEVRIEGQEVKKVAGGFLCPKTSKLDLLAHPLTTTYIAG